MSTHMVSTYCGWAGEEIAPPVAALVEDEPSGSGTKRPQSPRRHHRALLVLRHDGPLEDRTEMEHAAVLVRSPAACALGCSTGAT